MGSREDRIMSLASTLKASGLAKSEVQARMMAEEMIGVEESVQKKYDEEHAKAHEYLKTAKNLGEPRIKPQSQQEQRPKIEPIGTRVQPASSQASPQTVTPKVEVSESRNNILKPAVEPVHEKRIELGEVYTDLNFGKGTLKDLMLNQIQAENHEIKTIEQLEEEAEKRYELKSIPAEETIIEEHVEKSPEKESVDKASAGDASNVSNEEKSNEEKSADEKTKIDGEKLREIMEEDGPMEEHTREIKGKPENIRPKEDYVENTVDLSDMFNVNKK